MRELGHHAEEMREWAHPHYAEKKRELAHASSCAFALQWFADRWVERYAKNQNLKPLRCLCYNWLSINKTTTTGKPYGGKRFCAHGNDLKAFFTQHGPSFMSSNNSLFAIPANQEFVYIHCRKNDPTDPVSFILTQMRSSSGFGRFRVCYLLYNYMISLKKCWVYCVLYSCRSLKKCWMPSFYEICVHLSRFFFLSGCKFWWNFLSSGKVQWQYVHVKIVLKLMDTYLICWMRKIL